MAVSKEKIEYLYRKNLYYFPAGARFFIFGRRTFVKISSAKPVKPDKLLAEKPSLKLPPKRAAATKIGLAVTAEAAALAKEYRPFITYLTRNPELTLLNFDYATSHELALLFFFKSQELVETDHLIHEIKCALPYLINIFRNPVIHLKDVETILPLDAVKRINKNTVRHLSTHSENWTSVKGGSPMPKRMMTRVYEDDYGIYENIVFRDLVDMVLSFLRRRINLLSVIVDNISQSLRPDDFSRLMHSSYYLAVGKLFNGFFKTEDESENTARLKEARALFERLASFKNKAVYAKNAGSKPITGTVKKTNILGMHRDYRQVYSLYKKMQARTQLNYDGVLSEADTLYQNQLESRLGYGMFCQILTVFAAVYFSFKCDSAAPVFKDGRVSAALTNQKWRLKISTKPCKLLDTDNIEIAVSHKSGRQKFLLIPLSYFSGDQSAQQAERILKRLYNPKTPYDKYVFLSPFQENGGCEYFGRIEVENTAVRYAILPVSVNEINSFRRLQNLIFEGMMLTQDESCGFCGGLLAQNGNKLYCSKCRTVVQNVCCSHCGGSFKTVFADVKRTTMKTTSDFYLQEQLNFFRSVNMKMKSPICPHCGL